MGSIAKKICLLGDFSVGKTSLIRRFVDGKFSDEYLSTIGVKLSRKVVQIENTTRNVELLIWDLEGQSQVKSLCRSYLQGARGCIIVADVKRPETIGNLQDHLNLFFAINPQGWVILALNKIDLIEATQLDKLLLQYSFEHNQIIATYTTSAKTGQAVNDIFQQIAQQLLA